MEGEVVLRGSRFVVRFDDLCPTMDRRAWEKVEALIVPTGIRPIIGVIPDNRDPKLVYDRSDPAFWERIRGLQSLGWTVALHGYQHTLSSPDQGLCGWRPESEFAGVPIDEQRRRITAGLAILEAEGVRADAWMAPKHTFDASTLAVLSECGIDVVTDGFSMWPFSDDAGRFWIPCQLWDFRPHPFGVWTVCLHTNGWSDRTIDRFGEQLDRFRDRITSVPELREEFDGRRRSVLDHSYDRYRRTRIG